MVDDVFSKAKTIKCSPSITDINETTQKITEKV